MVDIKIRNTSLRFLIYVKGLPIAYKDLRTKLSSQVINVVYCVQNAPFLK